MKSYNGWSGREREDRNTEYNLALRQGTLPERFRKAGPCEICGQTVNTRFHNEQYGPTFRDFLESSHALCPRCHGMLHLRFRHPGRWTAYLRAILSGQRLPPVPHIGVVFGQLHDDADVPREPLRWSGPDPAPWYMKLTMERGREF